MDRMAISCKRAVGTCTQGITRMRQPYNLVNSVAAALGHLQVRATDMNERTNK